MINDIKQKRAQGQKKTRIMIFASVVFELVLVMVLGCSYSYGASLSIEVRGGGSASASVSQQEAVNEPNKPGNVGTEREIIETACGLIEEGKFDEARELVKASEGQKDQEQAAQLEGIVEKYDQMQKRRGERREEAYKEQITELARLKSVGLDGKGKVEDTNDANDANKPVGFTAVLATVTRAIEFADEGQKKELLSDSFVREAIDKAKAEAGQLEAKGKWLEAYIVCYSWLSALDPNNKEYKDYSEQLIDKAGIAASFQDSPCETGKQRFEGVKRRIFVRAVDALNFNYINKIAYREMAGKGVRQCRLLAEVVEVLTTEPNAESLGKSFENFVQDVNSLEKLRGSLSALEKEIDEWPEGAGKDRFISVFEKVLELNLTSARLPEEVVIAHFAESSFSSLDPYTVVVWPRQVQEFEKMMTNEFSGIGIEISKQKGQLTVASLLPDTPAYNSGLDAGDVIESVDGMATKDMSLPCAVKHITGPSGTQVKLMVRSEGQQEPRELTITRAKIIVPTVRGWERNSEGKWLYMVDEQEKIGYVRLTSFSEKTAEDMEEVLGELEKSGMRGLILDLRYNSGGYFDSAVEVANAFLDEGLIVITRPRFGIPIYSTARKRGTHPDYPIVVLINSGSASASEIVAGALGDPEHERATLVGERTHGKGVVQGITHYPGEGAQLKYTMAYYHLPSGKRVKSKEEAEKEHTNDWGVGPDVKMALRSNELRKMFDVQRDNDVLVKAGHDTETAPLKKYTVEETIEADPQLETAILVIKTKLIEEQAKSARKKAA